MTTRALILLAAAVVGLTVLHYTCAAPPDATKDAKPQAAAAAVAVTAAAPAAPDASGGSWPAFRGPGGDNHVPAVPEKLPAAAKPLWKADLAGLAYAGIVVADGKVIVHDHEKDDDDVNRKDIVRCFDADKGAALWKYSYENNGDKIDWGSCPRATPLIHDGMVYTLSARGKLCALDLKEGKLQWEKDLAGDFGGSVPSWGYCSSPALVAGNIVVGPGSNRSSLIALKPDKGATAWEAPGGAANYGGFLLAKVKGAEQLISYDQEDLTGRDPATGKVIWSHPIGANPGYVVPTPVVHDDKVLFCVETIAHSLSIGGKGKLEDAWDGDNDEFLVGNASPTVVDGMALGVVAGKGLMAVDLAKDPKTLWSTGEKVVNGDFGNILTAGGRALVLDSGGVLHLFSFDRKGAKELGKMKVCQDTMAGPALVGSRLYVRDEKAVYCYDLAAGGK